MSGDMSDLVSEGVAFAYMSSSLGNVYLCVCVGGWGSARSCQSHF